MWELEICYSINRNTKVEYSPEILQILLQNISNKSQLSIIDEIKISKKQQNLYHCSH